MGEEKSEEKKQYPIKRIAINQKLAMSA